jgi:hypothetical protein
MYIVKTIAKSLKGKRFHVLNSPNARGHRTIERQGAVTREVSKGVYEVTWYSWLHGYPNGTAQVRADEMQDWVFYSSDKAMVAAFATYPLDDPEHNQMLRYIP